MLVYVRHGKTALNGGGREERLRGWLPVPLAPKGEEQAQTTATRLAQILPSDPTTFRASDLHRTLQTAQIISDKLGVPFTPDSHVRDWNTGDMAGKKVDDMLPTMQALIKNPDVPAPGGESVNDYRQRFEPLMRQLVAAPGVHLVVGHARGSVILDGIADPEGGKGGDVPVRFLLDRPRLQPGGVMIVNHNWDVKIDNPEEKAA